MNKNELSALKSVYGEYKRALNYYNAELKKESGSTETAKQIYAVIADINIKLEPLRAFAREIKLDLDGL